MYMDLHEVMVHGCMVYTEHAKMAAVSHGTSHVTIKQHFGKYFLKYTRKKAKKKLDTRAESHVSTVSLLKWYIKVINNNNKLINNVCSS